VELIERLHTETDRAQAAHRSAEQANRAKSKFLAAASHDLRQPMHAQGLFLEVIGRGDLSDTQRKMLDNAQATSQASTEMLNTLLDFSRIEAGVVEPHLETFTLQTLLNKIESELAPQAVAKGLVFRTRETRAVVHSAPMLVELILRNLVTNAIRYTQNGGVLLACRMRGKQVSVEVWDTGIGIEASQHKEIFQEFHQLGNPERDRNKGLGLGLAIVDGLMRVLGYPLILASRPGQGSVFKLLLPTSDAPAVMEAPSSVPVAFGKLDLKVLVIDDDNAVRIGMEQLLRDWGCACQVAESVEEALEMVQQFRPNIVISDYRLREQRNGTEAIALLRKRLGSDLSALLITGDTAPERLREAQASGVPLLHKPVTPELLYRKLLEVQAQSSIN
jgi:CheY-like chemotaxis protein